MGLAASQARFLAITARKANCEFKSMQIAQDKLSITRELDKATTDYQNALNTTKLVWDTDGTGQNSFPLSYDIMMKPSAVNNYTPYMVTTKDGRIVLDSAMASAARQAGIPEEGINNKTITLQNGLVTTLYDQLYNQFINQMVKNGGMSETSAISVRSIGLIHDLGLGAPLLDKTQASAMGINDLIKYMDDIVTNSKYGTPAEQELAEKLQFEFGYDSAGTKIIEFKTAIHDKGDELSHYFTKNGVITTDSSFTFSDLLTENITYAKTNQKNPSSNWWKKALAAVAGLTIGFAAPLFGVGIAIGGGMICSGGIFTALGIYGGLTQLFKDKSAKGEMEAIPPEEEALLQFVDEMILAFADTINLDLQDPAPDATKVQAFNYAVNEILELLATDEKDLGARNHSVDAFNDAVDESNNYNGWVEKDANKGKNYGTRAISLSNLAESFMTFYAQGLNGYDNTYYINNASSKSHYVTDDPYYMWMVNNANANSSQEMYVAEFYSAMFNNIVQNGWVENDQIDDEEYLKNTLKNATYFISSLSSDNYYYQDRYLDNGYVIEVQDEDAIKDAEIAYTQMKHKLNAKEEKLDLEMKKIDLEISSLTSEYDTVKQLINKNVEKTFTMFN